MVWHGSYSGGGYNNGRHSCVVGKAMAGPGSGYDHSCRAPTSQRSPRIRAEYTAIWGEDMADIRRAVYNLYVAIHGSAGMRKGDEIEREL